MILPDVNVWLALAFQSHVHHEPAKSWLAVAEESIFFCRLTQQGLLRLATNRRAFGDEAVGLTEAWAIYDNLLADERIAFHEEPPSLEASWRSLTRSERIQPNVWSDAYLAAFSVVAGLQVVTFDSGLLHFDGINARLLTAT